MRPSGDARPRRGGGGRARAPRCCSACWRSSPLLARIVAQFQTEWLWFHELGQERVFWTMLASKWLAGSLAGLGTAMFLLVNFWVVERTAPP